MFTFLLGDCISNPTLCSEGISVSLLMKFDGGGFIISSGAQATHATGFSFSFENGKYRLRVATLAHLYEISLDSIPTTWFHLTFTWSRKDGLSYFENGTLISSSYTMKAESRVDDAYANLTLGRPNDATIYQQLYGRFYIAELVIWKVRLNSNEVLHAVKHSGLFLY